MNEIQILAQFEKEKGESFDDILQRVMKNASSLCSKTSDNDVDEEEE